MPQRALNLGQGDGSLGGVGDLLIGQLGGNSIIGGIGGGGEGGVGNALVDMLIDTALPIVDPVLDTALSVQGGINGEQGLGSNLGSDLGLGSVPGADAAGSLLVTVLSTIEGLGIPDAGFGGLLDGGSPLDVLSGAGLPVVGDLLSGGGLTGGLPLDVLGLGSLLDL